MFSPAVCWYNGWCLHVSLMLNFSWLDNNSASWCHLFLLIHCWTLLIDILNICFYIHECNFIFIQECNCFIVMLTSSIAQKKPEIWFKDYHRKTHLEPLHSKLHFYLTFKWQIIALFSDLVISKLWYEYKSPRKFGGGKKKKERKKANRLRPWQTSASLGFCCCSVTKSHLIPSDPMSCSVPDFPVLHYIPEFAQTHVHWVSDAIQPFHSLSPPSPPALNLSQHQGLF